MTLPVVCIHGALRSRAGMWPTALYLRRRGMQTRTFGYATRSGGLEDHAGALQAFLHAWLGELPPRIGFLTHSMGGLVVRAWLAACRPAIDVRVAMLSPPNQGSGLARANDGNPLFHLLYGDAASVLRGPGIEGLPAAPDNAEVLVLAGGRGDARGYNPALHGDDDGVVAVEEMSLPGVQLEFVGGLHSVLQWTPAVLDRAAAFLAQEER
ncbi:MAG: esterase/lipase family protein [Nannocystaceae bacterium]|nr:hypothetical protein [bacterium]